MLLKDRANIGNDIWETSHKGCFGINFDRPKPYKPRLLEENMKKQQMGD